MGTNVFAGGLLPFTPQATDALFDGLRQMFGKKNAKKARSARSWDFGQIEERLVNVRV
ncbi:hypothetical protein [Sinorhizobium meliloti]|nr:hypothetical protein U8C39_33665 [Sinorhizobium meliloti]WQP20071.1 hypothetical protein U8C33_34340 [Sinorhizobium meliloti]WQP33509.1 hypothetical protein U8C45_33630 [Sinorhizobium meliloti]